MKTLLVFLLLSLLGGVGGGLGAMAGAELGRGLVFVLGILGGLALVVAGVYLAARWEWITPQQRRWTMVGGGLGLGIATLVTLTTIYSSLGPLLSTFLIGAGAVLGSRIGVSAHDDV